MTAFSAVNSTERLTVTLTEPNGRFGQSWLTSSARTHLTALGAVISGLGRQSLSSHSVSSHNNIDHIYIHLEQRLHTNSFYLVLPGETFEFAPCAYQYHCRCCEMTMERLRSMRVAQKSTLKIQWANLYITSFWVKSVSARVPSRWRNAAIQLRLKMPLYQHDDPSSRSHSHLGTSHITLLTPRSGREGNPWLRPPPLHRRCCGRANQEPSPSPGMIIAKIIGQWALNPLSTLASAPDLKMT